jgi:arabinogalactan endo-1,4-beta-galactosidase
MNKLLFFIIVLLTLSCKKNTTPEPEPIPPTTTKILSLKAVDASFLNLIRYSGVAIKNRNGQIEDMLATLKNNGVNTIRLRIWNNPITSLSSLTEVKALSQEIKNARIKVWLTVHYSDTWADPGAQQKPAAWNGATVAQLKDSVYQFTKKIITQINPEYIQIGNEINNGFLWPEGNFTNQTQMIDLIKQGVKAVRDNSTTTKIIMHFAGHYNTTSFFSLFTNVDYDIIGLSYYPIWHGKNIDDLQANISSIGTQFNKDVIVAETAYPFTFGYNDFTNNILGDATQILPEYPATPQGQKDFLTKIKKIVTNAPRGIGFCYWGAEWIAFNGPTSTNGSSWENMALWDFSGQALPAIEVFKD